MGTRLKEKACSYPNVVHKIVEYFGACSMRERDEIIAEFSSFVKEGDHSYVLCTGWRISLVLKLSFEEYGLTIWANSAGPRWGSFFVNPCEHIEGSVN
jgi:hypothetical protein